MARQRGKKTQSAQGARRTTTVETKKFHPLGALKKPKFAFDVVKTDLLEQLRILGTSSRNIDDIVSSLKDKELVTIDEPTLKVSTNQDPVIATAENRGFEIGHAVAMKIYHARVEALRINQPFVKSTIMQKFVTKEMGDKLRK